GDDAAGEEPSAGAAGMSAWTGVSLFLMAALYGAIAVFRSAYAELNPVAASRLLTARGLVPRDGESAGDLSPVMRTTFDILHQALLVSASALLFRWLLVSQAPRPLLQGTIWIVLAVVLFQLVARSLAVSDPERSFSASLVVMALLYHALWP